MPIISSFGGAITQKNEEKDENVWHFETFLACLSFHEFQINHGRARLLLKAMDLDKQKLKILQLREGHIEKQRILHKKEEKLHSFFVKMVNAMKRNEQKLIECKDKIDCDVNEFKEATFANGHHQNDKDLLAVSAILPQRSSAIRLAKEHIQRRGSVVVMNEKLRQESVELVIEDIPKDFNPFGGGGGDSSVQSTDDDDDSS